MTGLIGNDTLAGGSGDDRIYGDDLAGIDPLGGDDSLLGDGGNDTIIGGFGDDTIDGGTDDDSISGGVGNDSLFGNHGDDTIDGGLGDDSIDGYHGEDSLTGGAGQDTILGGGGQDTIDGGDGNDLIDGGLHDDTILGGEGNDTIIGGGAEDSISGGGGADSIDGGDDNDTIYGDAGNDTIIGGDSTDSLFGGADNDLLDGGVHDDTLDGGDGNDTLLGGTGHDSLVGGNGNDSLVGGDGLDNLSGGAGNDTLAGGLHSDTLTGGDGFDVFVLDPTSISTETITDFNTATGGVLRDGNQFNNDFVDLEKYYNATTLAQWNASNPGNSYSTPLAWMRADQADGRLTQGWVANPNGGTTNVDLIIRNNNQSVAANNLTTDNTGVVCFTPGTMIETDRGAVAVETLRAGDLVVTRDRGLQAVRWTGSRAVSAAELALDPTLRPIRIRAGALGNGLPLADLTVSPMHRMLVASALIEAETGEAEALIAARNLVDLDGVEVLGADAVVYVHFMCDRHEVVLANGAPSETLNVGIHTARHMSPEAYAEITALFPELARSASVPVRKPLPGDWGRNIARRHAEEGLPLAG